MTRLQSQWCRLYAPQATDNQVGTDTDAPMALADAQGQVRAMVLELCRPAEWPPLAVLWQGVQADWGWPAPAIAINGHDGYQLWFSLQTPVGAAQAAMVLHALRVRYLPDVAPHRLRLMPHAHNASPAAGEQAIRMPGLPVHTEQWSAFVAQDLAPVFAETPWLDMQPSVEGQAELLSRLRSISDEAFQAALDACQKDAHTCAKRNEAAQQRTDSGASVIRADDGDDPKRFLLNIMNDTAVALALRIEAAKALLLHDKPRRHD
ncbi:MAG: hypothetical protein HY836_04000 [Aquabacterium sp.]|uniref:hypothetical protein n=1 Tax=Aquabacterium sp. TaxID=1872578 RepID=UPI0025C47B7A|nr:hypothetical protein [Aquabacterium sp.]MBI5924739.1 hypothetical protein [Aquabacterium sp.]